VLRVVVMPALAMLTVCCSITCGSTAAPSMCQDTVTNRLTLTTGLPLSNLRDVQPAVLCCSPSSSGRWPTPCCTCTAWWLTHLMDGGTVTLLHLVKLVNAAHPPVSQHQGTSLQDQLLGQLHVGGREGGSRVR
jgi:hypothetical protein